MTKGERRQRLLAVLCALMVALQTILQVLDDIVVTTPPPSENDVARGKIVPLAMPTILAVRGAINQFIDGAGASPSSQQQEVLRQMLEEVPFRSRGPNIPRKTWRESSIFQAMHEWPDREWQKRFHLKRPVFQYLVQ